MNNLQKAQESYDAMLPEEHPEKSERDLFLEAFDMSESDDFVAAITEDVDLADILIEQYQRWLANNYVKGSADKPNMGAIFERMLMISDKLIEENE